jgi:predicted adenylyl cyclase CyaB
MKNIELKATAGDFSRLRRTLRSLGARREPAALYQIDRYFSVPKGRLKLRRRKGDRSGELIFYIRPDARKARASEYQKLPVADAARMLRTLESMFTPTVCIRKRRELWLDGDSRIHLDRVDGLGTFVEIEVPVTHGTGPAMRIMRTLSSRLGISPACVQGRSYSDMLPREAPSGNRARAVRRKAME